MKCPRRRDNPGPFNYGDTDEWRRDHTCSYCGSLHPDLVMWLVAGGVEVVPTDKDYKIYLRGVKVDGIAKFYFQHFSDEQRREFVALLNQGTMTVVGGGFYVLPYFCERVRAPLVRE